MSYEKPTLSQLIESIKSDLYSRFPGLDPQLTNSFASNLAEVLAGAANGLYGYLDWIADQVFVDTASDENAERWASIFGLSRLAATKATGDATFAGAIGSSVVTGAELVASDGTIFTVDSGFTLAATSEDHAITAQTAGTDGNLDALASLSFVSTPSGMDATATATSAGITGGTERETDADLRVRTIAAISSPPKGGKAGDYEVWATESPTDVSRSWVRNTTTGAPFGDSIPAGEVWQWFVMDDVYNTNGSDLVTNGGFDADSDWTKGTGWTIGSGVASKAAGSASSLDQVLAVTNGKSYRVTFTVSNYSAGTLTPKIGTDAGQAVSADGTYIQTITSASGTTFALDADASFVGDIDAVSVLADADGNYGIPATGDATDLEAYISPLIPVTAIYDAKIPIADAVDVNLTIVPDTPANQDLVESELRSTILNERSVGGAIKLADVYEAMSRVPSLTNWTVNTINQAAPADVTVAAGTIHTIGTFEFI